MTRGWIVAAVAGIGAVVGDVLLRIELAPPRSAAETIAHAAVGGAWIAAGLVAWARRPSLRIGALMSAVGFVWLLSQPWWPAPLPRVGSYILNGVALAVGVHAVLAFPTGRLATGRARALVVSAYATVLGGNLVSVALAPDAAGRCSGCARDLLLVDPAQSPAAVVWTVASLTLALGVIAGVLLVQRWQGVSPAGRAVLGPVMWTGVLATATVVVRQAVGLVAQPRDWLSEILFYATWLTIALVPAAFLLGLLRARLRRGTITELIVELGGLPAPDAVRCSLARALGDPSLRLVFWQPDTGAYIDTDGLSTLVADDDSARAVTMLEHAGQRVGALVHDPYILEDRALLEAVGVAGSLAIENARLQSELRTQLANVRASRARIVQAGDAVRRRIERDLHDGAQQRLLGIRLALRLANTRVGRDDGQVHTLLAEADSELSAGLDELRALARGIHPAVLTDEGLAAALAGLSRRSPIPVELAALPTARLPPPLEAAVYFVASEALANIAKHANASHATITVTEAGGRVRLKVTDDGVGGADPEAGSGLSGLTDRVEALDGQLQIDSDPGAGTTVLADLPCPHQLPTPRSS